MAITTELVGKLGGGGGTVITGTITNARTPVSLQAGKWLVVVSGDWTGTNPNCSISIGGKQVMRVEPSGQTASFSGATTVSGGGTISIDVSGMKNTSYTAVSLAQ